MMPRVPQNRTKGFTLIEVMIALGLLALIGVSVANSMFSSFYAKDLVSTTNERFHEGRQVMTRISRELRMAFLRAEPPRESREEDPAVQTRFKGEDDEIYFASTAHVPIFKGVRESDQAEISYFLARRKIDSEYKGQTLFRRESKRIDDRPDKGGHIWPVVEGVKTFKLEYWDDKKEIGDDAWQRDWDSHENELEPLLPARIRITLELEMLEDQEPLRFVTQAAPKVRRPINVIESQVKGKALK